MLTKVAFGPGDGRWLCRCSCGRTELVDVRKRVRCSVCGPLDEVPRQRARRLLFEAWLALARCYDRRHREFPVYGGLGVSVCPAWRDRYQLAAAIAELPGADDPALELALRPWESIYGPGTVEFVEPFEEVYP